MTVYSQTLINPGAEAGTTTGWTNRSGSGMTVTSGSAHSGSWKFEVLNSFVDTSKWDQEITVDAAREAAIDANSAALKASAWLIGGFNDTVRIYVECRDSGGALLGSLSGNYVDASVWTIQELYFRIPALTRKIRIGADFVKNVGTVFNNNVDDFALEISDNPSTDYIGYFDPKAFQLGIYALGTSFAGQARGLQLGLMTLEAAETSSGLHEVNAHQLGIYVLCRPNADRRELRAWTFKQDDNEFYGIQLGNVGTLVWDKLSYQWCQWRSPGYAIWRVEDVVDWEGYNIAGDTESGKLWKIDPTGRLDYSTTPIVSTVVGYLTHRMRMQIPCYMAELAVSEGQPPDGIAEGAVGITLRTSTDDGQTFVNHGESVGEGIGEDMTVRWYGVGLMEEPGILFELTDTGYARRIDGLNIETKE